MTTRRASASMAARPDLQEKDSDRVTQWQPAQSDTVPAYPSAQRSTSQHISEQYSAAMYSTAQYSTVHHRIVQCCRVPSPSSASLAVRSLRPLEVVGAAVAHPVQRGSKRRLLRPHAHIVRAQHRLQGLEGRDRNSGSARTRPGCRNAPPRKAALDATRNEAAPNHTVTQSQRQSDTKPQ